MAYSCMKNEFEEKNSKHSNKESKIPSVQRVNSHDIFIDFTLFTGVQCSAAARLGRSC